MKLWASLMGGSYHDIHQLKDYLNLSKDELDALRSVQEQFPMFVNPYYLSLIDLSDPDDPIRKMCIPAVQELNLSGSLDTSGELSNTVIKGLQHKYERTAIILSTNQCAMNCRHCFRRRMVGVTEEESAADLNKIGKYIEEHTEISNVLISGGDAFMNSNANIRKYLSRLCEIPHLDLIRFGTRTPVVLPQRITSDAELKDILSKYAERKKIYVITQFNHPKEITEESVKAIDELLKIGIPVRNQTVLLKGVNDDPVVLGTLMKGLTAVGVVPYYVFQCRPVTGVMNHFQLPLRTGYEIVEKAKDMQNGLGKSFRYIMSHVTGKIEILGIADDKYMMFKYHQAKYGSDKGSIFKYPISKTKCWL